MLPRVLVLRTCGLACVIVHLCTLVLCLCRLQLRACPLPLRTPLPACILVLLFVLVLSICGSQPLVRTSMHALHIGS